ncbi:MAG: TIGR02221 family CRISPR-associated protein [Spirochaetota bacterium]
MAKVMLSFLGTNKYLKCNYEYNNVVIKNVYYVQEAIAKLFCNEWGKGDSIIVFVTQEAYKTNWVTGTSYDNKKIDGLEKVLQIFAQEKNVTVKYVTIYGGRNEDEIWSIFDAVINSVNQGDEIIIDVTHAFRAIPMFAVVVINYLQMVKNVSFIGLYYGAIESLGRLQDIALKNIEERNAPIIDLSSFVYLLQFSNGVYNFIQYGDANEISKYALNTVKPILKETQGKDEISQKIRHIAESLKTITQNFAYCRGKDIIKYNFAKLYRDIQELKEHFNGKVLSLKPLQPLLDNILQKLDLFKEFDDVINAKKGIVASWWCLQHNLIQQSITILQESLITLVCIKFRLDYENLKYRELVGSAFYKINSQKRGKVVHKDENKEIEPLLSDPLILLLSDIYNQLTQIRNDINHANFRKDIKKCEDIYKEIWEVLEKVLSIITV